MKVIGLTKVPNQHYTSSQDDAYIVVVKHSELERAFEKGYRDELKKLGVGDELDLSSLPNQRERVIDATKAMQDAYEKFVKAAPVMAEVARVIGAAQQKEGGAS